MGKSKQKLEKLKKEITNACKEIEKIKKKTRPIDFWDKPVKATSMEYKVEKYFNPVSIPKEVIQDSILDLKSASVFEYKILVPKPAEEIEFKFEIPKAFSCNYKPYWYMAPETLTKQGGHMAVSKANSAKTQKAKGVLIGLKYFNDEYKFRGQLCSFLKVAKHRLVKKPSDILDQYYDYYSKGTYPFFARPCPMEPRHGFVESVIVKNKDELKKLWKEVRKQDKKGEIILGPHLPTVDKNAVYVNSGSLSIGKGHDGATGGNDSISFPVAPQKFPMSFRKNSGLKKTDAVYLEAVKGNGTKWQLVQARGGPKISATSPDFVPKQVTVKHIVRPHNDLLRWEKEARSFKPGTVVYGNGHTLASHAAIHCVLNKVPFITSSEPKIGDVVKPTQSRRSNKINRKEFRRGVRVGLDVCKDSGSLDMERLFYFSLSVLHNWAYLKESSHASWLLGSASTIFSKICASLSFGEHRHKGNGYMGRSQVYSKIMRCAPKKLNGIAKVFEDFHQKHWGSGYGGKPWATCAWYSYCLWRQVIKVYNRRGANLSDKEVVDTITFINKTTNLAHNNGWWFNKFTMQSSLDFIAKDSGFVAFIVSDVYLKIYNALPKAKNIGVALPRIRTVKAPFYTNKDGEIAWLVISSARKYTDISLWLENGKSRCKDIKLSNREITYLKKRYKKERKDIYSDLTLSVKSNGKFNIPGGRTRDLRKVFKVA